MDTIQSSFREQALNAANRALSNRFGEADFALAAGSIIRGNATVGSDIDLVVVLPRLERAWRESFDEGPFPVEAFVHDLETLRYFMDLDVKSGCPVMVNMVASGQVIGRGIAAGRQLQAVAQATLAKGPFPLSGQSYDALRYQVSDLVDDLRGKRPPDEVFAIANALYQKLGDLILLGRGAWTGRGKWLPRMLKDLDLEIADRFAHAFRCVAEGEAGPLLTLAERELDRHGGRYFAGYKLDAPLEARTSIEVKVP
jgi:hypothetical protein